MKYLFKNLYVLLLAFYSFAQAQLPTPDVVWTFDRDGWNSNIFLAKDANSNNFNPAIDASTNGIAYGDFTTDRSNNSYKALTMRTQSIIDFSTPNGATVNKFYGLYPLRLNELKEITISMWVKFTNSTTDERLLFGAKEENNINDNLKFGLALKGETLILKRYFEEPSGEIGTSWNYECFQPAAFDAGFGWYQIIITFDKVQKYMRLFVGKPNGGATYGPGAANSTIPGDATVTREFDGRLIWIPGIRKNTNLLRYWFIGNAEGLVFDDMMIFDESFTVDQAKALWNDQKPASQTQKTASNKVVREIESLEPILSTALKLYPNPSKDGTFNLEFALKEDGPVSFEIVNLSGQLVFKQQKQHLKKGNQKFELGGRARGDVNLASGFYILNVSTNEFSKALKLLVE